MCGSAENSWRKQVDLTSIFVSGCLIHIGGRNQIMYIYTYTYTYMHTHIPFYLHCRSISCITEHIYQDMYTYVDLPAFFHISVDIPKSYMSIPCASPARDFGHRSWLSRYEVWQAKHETPQIDTTNYKYIYIYIYIYVYL